MNDQLLHFEKLNLWNKEVFILDADRNRMGMIYQSKWGKSATIELLDNRKFHLKTKGIFSRKWMLFADQNVLMEFSKESGRQGAIKYLFLDELLILAGLYVITN